MIARIVTHILIKITFFNIHLPTTLFQKSNFEPLANKTKSLYDHIWDQMPRLNYALEEY